MKSPLNQFLTTLAICAATLLWPDIVCAAPVKERPNILLVIADDWGWGHAGVLGDRGIKTPNFDRLAKEGALFRNAYCAAPTCSASRASLLTGQMFYRLGEAANLHGPLDAKYPVYPDLLESAGYAVGMVGKGWAPGNFKAGGRTRNPAGPMAKDFKTFLESVPADQPFCFWFGSLNPHRPFDQKSLAGTVDPKSVTVPAFLPDTPEVRADLVEYYAEVQAFDREIGSLLKVLEQSGRLENTLIVVTSDNGMPFPRAKCNIYDSGTRMPTAIRWGAHVKPGQVVDDFVSLTDLAPTFLAAAGQPVPAEMSGKSLLPLIESNAPGQDFVVTGRERHGGSDYPCRAIRTTGYLYIRNYHPADSPAAADSGPALAFLAEHKADPAMEKYWKAFGELRPAEELYDNSKDPDQMHNVAEDPAYASIKKDLSRKLDEYLAATGDPRGTGKGEVFDSYPIRGTKAPAP